MFLDVHLEYCDDKGERLRQIAETGKPFNLSPVPIFFFPRNEVFRTGVYPLNLHYSREVIEVLKHLVKTNSNVTFGQQGFSHYCSTCYGEFIQHGGRKKNSWPDPWHENKCLSGKARSVDEQAGFMLKGKKVIEEILEVSPVIYVAPNHQFDKNTKMAAEQVGYQFFAERGILTSTPYRDGNLIILPERKINLDGKVVYTHYDEMAGSFSEYLKILNASTPLTEIAPLEKSRFKSALNYQLLIGKKKLRDVVHRVK
jgi:hypothetical protein